MRHSCAHVMAEAICSLWPQTKLVYGPTVQDGFYYDIDLDEPIRPDDFPRIEARMQEIVEADKPFTRREMSRQEALEKLKGDKYKTDNIERADGDVISFYSHGDNGFQDLCRGPHVPSTGKVGSFKIMSVAGAYWHGDRDAEDAPAGLRHRLADARKTSTSTSTGSKRPRNAIIASSASSWTCSASARWGRALPSCTPRA